MDDFALVTEGATDQAVLENILLGYFQGQAREPVVNREHPNPQAPPTGGWTLLLEYLKGKKFREAFQLNQYLIIQVDTDVSEHKGFDVAKQDENGPLSVERLVANVIERLKQEIGAEDWLSYGDRFIFAIAVNEVECWVLPLHEQEASKAGKIVNCLEALAGALKRASLDAEGKQGLSVIRGCFSRLP